MTLTTTITAEETARLIAELCNGKPQRSGGYLGDCPIHGHRRNLSISVGADDTVLIHCHANKPSCTFEAIAAWLGERGIPLAALFPPKHDNHNGNSAHLQQNAPQRVRAPKTIMLDYALALHKHGARVVAQDGKQPLPEWSPIRDAVRQTVADVRGQVTSEKHAPAWQYAKSVGVVMGCAGWRGIDFDDQDRHAVDFVLDRLGLPADYPWIDAAKDSYHLWLRSSENPSNDTSTNRDGIYGGRVELKSHDVLMTMRPERMHTIPATPPAYVDAVKLRAIYDAVTVGETAQKHKRVTSFTAAELLETEFPDPVWAVPGLLPEGLNILAGRPKVGKSWLALQIAIAVSTGGMMFNQRVERGKVLYFAIEDNGARMKARAAQLHMPKDADLTIKLREELPHLLKGGAEVIAGYLSNTPYRLIVIDTLGRIGRAGKNDEEAVAQQIDRLQGLALEHHAAILLVDHHRKSAGMVEDVIDDVISATSKTAAADGVLGLYHQRGKREATLRVVGRDLPEDRDLVVVHDRDTGAWQLVGNADDVRTTERQREVLTALGELGSATNQQIANYVGQDKRNTLDRVIALVNMGKVRRTDVKGKALYSLIDTDTTHTTTTTDTTPTTPTTDELLL